MENKRGDMSTPDMTLCHRNSHCFRLFCVSAAGGILFVGCLWVRMGTRRHGKGGTCPPLEVEIL